MIVRLNILLVAFKKKKKRRERKQRNNYRLLEIKKQMLPKFTAVLWRSIIKDEYDGKKAITECDSDTALLLLDTVLTPISEQDHSDNCSQELESIVL